MVRNYLKNSVLRRIYFYKEFYEEFYPLSLYASLKYPKENYFLYLCKRGCKSDAEIINSENLLIENIQITSSSFNYNHSLKEEKMIKDGCALGIGTFYRNKKDNTILQKRGLRSPASAISEVKKEIMNAIMKKLNYDSYENIDVLLITSEYPLSKWIENYFEILEKDLKTYLEKFSENIQRRFKEIYLLDYSNFLLKLV